MTRMTRMTRIHADQANASVQRVVIPVASPRSAKSA
jgi:hypothetical protein